MKTTSKKNWLDYTIYVVWGLVFLMGIYSFTGSPEKSIVWFIGLGLAIPVYYKLKIPKGVYLGIMFILLANAAGETVSGIFSTGSSSIGFFYTVQNYDKLMHLLDPLIACTFFYFLFEEKVENKKILILLSITLLLSFELSWEIWEYFSDATFGTHLQGVFIYVKDSLGNLQLKETMSPLTDTIYDMFYNLIGSLIWGAGALFFTRNYKNKKQKIRN